MLSIQLHMFPYSNDNIPIMAVCSFYKVGDKLDAINNLNTITYILKLLYIIEPYFTINVCSKLTAPRSTII